MNNQTIFLKDIIELGQTYTPHPGYCLVIYKKGVLKSVMPEGQGYNASFFEKKSLDVIGVISPASERSTSFKASNFHIDNIHQFTMEYYIDYKVFDVRLFADQRLQDPLRKMMERIKRTIGIQIGKISWDELYNSDASDFEEIKKEILDYKIPDLNNEANVISSILQNYATTFGITLTNIDFKFIIPDNYLIQKKKREEYQRNREIKQIEHNEKVQDKIDEGELSRIAAQNESSKVFTSIINAVDKSITNIGNDIDNPDKFLHAIEVGIKANNKIQNDLINNPSLSSGTGLPSGNSSQTPQLAAGSSQSFDQGSPNSQYFKLINNLRESDLSPDVKKSFFTKYIRLVLAVFEGNEDLEDQLINQIIELGLPIKISELIGERNKFVEEIKIIIQ